MPRLLLIDDDQSMNDLIRRVAEGCGFEVRTTSKPAEFMDLVEEFDPDLIGLDIAMPETDGIELIKCLSESACRARVLIVSGLMPPFPSAAERLGLARGLDMVGTIAKPFRVEELRRILAEAVLNPTAH
jgi:DNA-binding response OmpR family regulator